MILQCIHCAVQIQNIGESCLSHPLILIINAHMGCQIEEPLRKSVIDNEKRRALNS